MAPLKLKNHSWLSPVWWAKGFLVLVPFFSVSSWLKALWLSRIVYNDGKWLTGWRGNLFTSCAAIHLVKPHHCLNPQPWILRKAIYLGLLVWAPVPHPHPLPQFPTPFAETWIAILLYLPMAILIKIKHSFVRKKPQNISDPYVTGVTITQAPVTKLVFPWRRPLSQGFISYIFFETLMHTPATMERNMISQAGCLETTPVFLKLI